MKLAFEVSILLLTASNRENVVDVDSNENSPLRGGAIINTPFTHETSEAPIKHCTVELFILDTSTLMHTIQLFVEFPHPGFLTGC